MPPFMSWPQHETRLESTCHPFQSELATPHVAVRRITPYYTVARAAQFLPCVEQCPPPVNGDQCHRESSSSHPANALSCVLRSPHDLADARSCDLDSASCASVSCARIGLSVMLHRHPCVTFAAVQATNAKGRELMDTAEHIGERPVSSDRADDWGNSPLAGVSSWPIRTIFCGQ